MKRNHSFVFAIFFCCILTGNLSAGAIQYIRLDIDNNRIELGDLSLNGRQIPHISIQADDIAGAKIFSSYFESIVPAAERNSTLFFVHCMWGSNPIFTRYQADNFWSTYINDPDCNIKHVFYVIWDTYSPTYAGNKRNADVSAALLNTLFGYLDVINIKSDRDFNLMCHSMGNKIFVDVLKTNAYDQLFHHVILAAPDVNEKTFISNDVQDHLATISEKTNVLYNHHDFALHLSKWRNLYQPLGLKPEKIMQQSDSIDYIDCSWLPDNHLFEGSITGHIYYSSSETAKTYIKKILAE